MMYTQRSKKGSIEPLTLALGAIMSLFSQLEELQWKQLQHDEKYHKDIWLLPVQQRITHMVLHLAKYNAQLSVAAFENNSDAFKKSIVDSLIIIISACNIFNSRIFDIALSDSEKECSDIRDLVKTIISSQPNDTRNDLYYLSHQMTLHIGKMCKATESLDHLESYPFRQSLIESLGKVFRTAITSLYSITDEDIQSIFSKRLIGVEKKNMFFSRLGNYDSGY